MEMSSWMVGLKPTRHTGIFETKGGYRVRVRAVDPRTGTLKEANRSYESITVKQALIKQEEMREEIQRGGLATVGERPKYADYATSLFERKLAKGELTSAKSEERWADTQDLHLIPAFGEFFVDAIRRVDIEGWLAEQGRKVKHSEYAPATVNGWLSILLTTLRSAGAELDLAYDATRGIKPLDTSTWHTYTEEEPNSLTVEEAPRFMAKALELFPQHFAMIALGLSTGRRPCELRPLRRKGETPDLLWDEGVLLVRRSETKGKVVERTKTKRNLRIPLPAELVDILQRHVYRLKGPMRKSELLFPSLTGGFRSGSCLDKPIEVIAKAAKIDKSLTAYFMRRTFQDLGRLANVHDFVVRAVSGHATASMQQHYSTVTGEEVRRGLAKVISLAGFIPRRVEVVKSGDAGGDAKP